MKKCKTTEFESNVRKWALREAIDILGRTKKETLPTFDEILSVANELVDFVLLLHDKQYKPIIIQSMGTKKKVHFSYWRVLDEDITTRKGMFLLGLRLLFYSLRYNYSFEFKGFGHVGRR